MNRKEIQNTLNKFGSSKEPFLFLLSYDLNHFFIEKLSSLNNQIKFEINQKSDLRNIHKTSMQKFPISFDEYKKKFDYLQEQIQNGNTYLCNLTSKTQIKTDYSLDEIYKNVQSIFKIRFQNEDENFVCFSPEKFVQINDDKIFTYPMKGTIDSSIPNAKEKILANKKEMAEHTMVVDLLRNDLGIVATNVRVDDFRYIDEINAGEKKLLQVSSKISAKLENNWHEKIGDIFVSLLPAGSISGTPKRKTVEILEKIEAYERGFYTGIFGYFDGKDLQSFVLIRFIEEDKKGNKYYKSGGGITCDSDAFEEYQELIDKVYLPF